VLPVELKAHEIGRADRLNFRPQPIERIAMNTRQQAPIAPFERGSRRREPAAQYNALRLERRQGRVDERV
jgi:hypothetical protein